MAVNDISPGFIKINYAVGTRFHVMTLPVIPLSPDPLVVGNQVQARDGAPIDFDNVVDDVVLQIKGFFHTSTDFSTAELWSKPTPADNPLFIEGYTIGVQGTSPTAANVDGQAVLTHRTAGGGIHRFYLMESTFASNIREKVPFTSGALNTLSAYLRGFTSAVVGRDGTVLAAPVAFTSKTNDALRKRRLYL